MTRNSRVIIPVILYRILIATAVVGAGPPSFAVVDPLVDPEPDVLELVGPPTAAMRVLPWPSILSIVCASEIETMVKIDV